MTCQLADIFEALCDEDPNAEALHAGPVSLSRGELDRRANRLAHYLVARGIQPGDHVGIYAYNCAEWLEALIACWKCRATAININFRYVRDELRYMWDNSDMVALIYQKSFAPLVDSLRAEFPELKTYLWLDDGSDGEDPGDIAYEEALASQPETRNFDTRSPDDIYIIYTGGTTGLPKGVMWRHHDFYHNVISRKSKGPAGPSGEAPAKSAMALRSLILSPMMHGGGQWAVLITILNGGVAAIPVSRRFDPREVLETIAAHEITMLQIIGDAMAQPLAHQQLASPVDLPSLRIISSGGAILTAGARARLAQAFGTDVFITGGIGGSEMGSAAIEADSGDTLSGPRFRAAGNMAIVDDDLNVLEAGSGAIGHLATRGHVPLGYYKAPEKTAEVFRTDKYGERWVLAGDRARIEDDGSFTLLGRDSQCINSGGEKIFVEEVERAVAQHPDVAFCAVVGVPDPTWQQKVVAVVELRESRTTSLESIQAVCRQHVAGYKIPRALVIAQLPKMPNGKIDYKWATTHAREKLGC